MFSTILCPVRIICARLADLWDNKHLPPPSSRAEQSTDPSTRVLARRPGNLVTLCISNTRRVPVWLIGIRARQVDPRESLEHRWRTKDRGRKKKKSTRLV